MTDTSAPDTRAEALARFDEAAELLTGMRGQLVALAAAEQHQQAASRSIDEARDRLVGTSAKLDEATTATLEALPALRGALSNAETFLATTDLTRLADEMAEIRRMIESDARDRVRAAEAERDEALTLLTDEMAEIRRTSESDARDRVRAVEAERDEALTLLTDEMAEIRRTSETDAEDRVRAAEAERDEASTAHQALLDKIAALPDRVRRKHNLL